MNYLDRERYKRALAATVAQGDGPRFNVTATLPPSASAAVLEDRLRAWDARINRYYLGRGWAKAWRRADRMRGIVFFETKPYPHAHCVLAPPRGASPDSFACAAFFFAPGPGQPTDIKPVTLRGRMLVQQIRPTQADVIRVANYASKELEWRGDAAETWKFVDQLAGLQRTA